MLKIIVTILILILPRIIFAQFPSRIILSQINGVNGIKIIGLDEGQQLGYSVSGVGDFNNDGKNDVVLGSPFSSIESAYLIFGENTSMDSPLSISALSGGNGFKAKGVGNTGLVVNNVGDFNGDGIDDVIIAASHTGIDVNYKGIAYLLYGSDQPLLGLLDLANLTANQGFIINRPDLNETPDYSVSSAGDINDDGLDDIVISTMWGDFNQTNNGLVFVIYGSSANTLSSIDLDAINGSNGVMIYGEIEGENAGASISGIGDFNGDGIDDLVIGAPGARPNGVYLGKTYVVFGKQTLPHPLALGSLNGTTGIKVNGEGNLNDFGNVSSVASNFDFNDDGFKDILIGAKSKGSLNQPRSGRAYVIYGYNNPLVSVIELSQLSLSQGLKINGLKSDEKFGFSVSSAGDFNGDKIDDVIIGAVDVTSNNDSKFSAVIFGTKIPILNGFDDTLDLFPLPHESGVKIIGIGKAGYSVGSAGDFNGDGIDDVIIGAPATEIDSKVNTGAAYIIYGKSISIFNNGFE